MTDAEMKQYKKIFDEFDTNKKGHLVKKDAFDAIRVAGFNPSEAQLEQAIKVCGIKNSAKVTFNEFATMTVEISRSDCPDEFKLRESLFRLDQHNGGGLIKMEELAHVLKLHGETMTDAEVKQLLASLPDQKDGDIDDIMTILTCREG